MKFIDFFAGIGGFHTGLEKAGHECVGWVEWDKFARESYQAIYDTDGLYTATDVQDVKGVDLPDADLWTFGSPCTDISLAGRREGLEGKHSSMFFEIIRCLEERAQAQKELPAFLLMENVKALLSSNGGWDFARVLIEMDKVGYDCEWKVYNTAQFLPQNRERVYIIGHSRKKNTAQVFSERSTGRELPKIVQIGNLRPNGSFGGNPQTGRVYSPYGLSPTLNTMQGGGRVPIILIDGKLRRLTPKECWRLQGFTDEQFDKAREAGLSDTQLYKQAGNAVSVPVVYDIGKRLRFVGVTR